LSLHDDLRASPLFHHLPAPILERVGPSAVQRRFVKSDKGTLGDLVDAVSGSFHVFWQLDRDPMRSVNFITAHDGFTLNDLVSYNDKHNQANGEDNRDGNDQNDSWNCGIEGPTDDADVEALRERQIRNFFTILFLSQGRPMFLMGDEVRHTQGGNNNAYSQDNEISWFDWGRVEEQGDLFRFVSGLLRFRQGSLLYRDRRYWFEPGGTDVFWHGVRLNEPDRGENYSRSRLRLWAAGPGFEEIES